MTTAVRGETHNRPTRRERRLIAVALLAALAMTGAGYLYALGVDESVTGRRQTVAVALWLVSGGVLTAALYALTGRRTNADPL